MGWPFFVVGGVCCRSIGSAVAIIVNLYRVERDHVIHLQWKRTRGMVKLVCTPPYSILFAYQWEGRRSIGMMIIKIINTMIIMYNIIVIIKIYLQYSLINSSLCSLSLFTSPKRRQFRLHLSFCLVHKHTHTQRQVHVYAIGALTTPCME